MSCENCKKFGYVNVENASQNECGYTYKCRKSSGQYSLCNEHDLIKEKYYTEKGK